jgi:hypothetical protein
MQGLTTYYVTHGMHTALVVSLNQQLRVALQVKQ